MTDLKHPLMTDEPVALFRGCDRKALRALKAYAAHCDDEEQRAAIVGIIDQFAMWSRQNAASEPIVEMYERAEEVEQEEIVMASAVGWILIDDAGSPFKFRGDAQIFNSKRAAMESRFAPGRKPVKRQVYFQE